MKRVDVLKGIEQILVQKAYETGHISHRADGDWQKQADGSWIPYKGQSNQSVPQAQESAPAENTKYSEIVKQDFESVPKSIKDKMFTIAQQYKAEWAEDSDEDMRSMAEDDVEAISQMLWDNADEETRNSWLDSNDEEDLVETPEVDLYNADQVDLSGYAHNISIDNGSVDNDDLEDVANQILLDNNLEVNDDNMNKARDAMISWLDANGYLDSDEPSDDEIYDYEDDLANEEDKFNQYKISHPRPALSNDGHSKGLTSEKDMFEDAVERFEELTDPYNDERLTAGEAIKQMKEEMEYGKGIDPETYTPAIESGFKKFSDWISDFAGVEKSAVRDMRSTPTTKNVGF